MQGQFYPFTERSRRLWQAAGCQKLAAARVVVLGLGGVGSAAAEGLCRAGVGNLLLIDFDTIDITNLNRQIVTTTANIGLIKAEEVKKRLLSINPEGNFTAYNTLINRENMESIGQYMPDYVVDAVDMVTTKLDLAAYCQTHGFSLLTCLGTGNRLDPSQLTVGTTAKTAGTGCPLARVMRRELNKRGLAAVDCVYSLEVPAKPTPTPTQNGRNSPASTPFVPPAAGMLLASHVVRALLGPST